MKVKVPLFKLGGRQSPIIRNSNYCISFYAKFNTPLNPFFPNWWKRSCHLNMYMIHQQTIKYKNYSKYRTKSYLTNWHGIKKHTCYITWIKFCNARKTTIRTGLAIRMICLVVRIQHHALKPAIDSRKKLQNINSQFLTYHTLNSLNRSSLELISYTAGDIRLAWWWREKGGRDRMRVRVPH